MWYSTHFLFRVFLTSLYYLLLFSVSFLFCLWDIYFRSRWHFLLGASFKEHWKRKKKKSIPPHVSAIHSMFRLLILVCLSKRTVKILMQIMLTSGRILIRKIYLNMSSITCKSSHLSFLVVPKIPQMMYKRTREWEFVISLSVFKKRVTYKEI